MNITFLGNCQTVSLCFYFQQLLKENNNICWVSYGEEIKPHIIDSDWSKKCKNKIFDYNNSIQTIKDSDIIVYQTIDEAKSLFSNTKTLNEIKKCSCKLIQIPSIHLIYNDFDNSIKELINRETANNVDIKVSTIFNNFKEHNLMLSCWHPNTFLFMEIVKILCNLLNISFFTKDKYFYFLRNKNFMELP